MNDFFLVFAWWVIVSSLGIIFLPLTFKFFGKFFDKGYPLAKIIGLAIISYLVWLLGSLKILPFVNQTIWLVIGIAAGANFWLFKKNQKEIKQIVRSHWRFFVFEEILLFSALLFWAWVRGFQPNIQGLEKFMDYGFVNAILRSRFFPPADMWLAGETINYYYFGHLVTAVLTKISGLDSVITYNLMLALLFALILTASFCLGFNLLWHNQKTKKIKKAILIGLLTAFLVSLGGNLHPFYWWLKNKNFTTYWYPDATRFIVEKFGAGDNTIHEFPIYSFVVADLHGHLLNLPFVLLFLALLLTIVFHPAKLRRSGVCLSVSFLLGIFLMTNTWDFPIYGLIFGLTVFYFNFVKHSSLFKILEQTVKTGLACGLGAIIFSLPFQLNFQNITQGVALTDFHSPLWMLLVLWGFPLLISLSFLLVSAIKKIKLNHADNFVLITLAVCWLLIFLPELIYVKDIYIHSHQRANTVFKLTYQAFVMFGLTIPYIIIRVSASLKRKAAKFILHSSFFILLVFIAIYPRFAIRSYYGLKNYQGITAGLNFLKNNYPDDYAAILWLKNNVTDQPVIVEAVGESYTDFARVSANTGLPAVLGWRVHEWLWRGSFDEAGRRTEVVREIYETEDKEKTKQLLRQYRVKYVFLGNLEHQQYTELDEEKFNQLGEIVFNAGQTKIYQVKN